MINSTFLMPLAIALALSGAQEARALSCNVLEGLPTGLNRPYQPGTLFGWTFQCSGAPPQYIDYQWAPPLADFMRNPHAFAALWESAAISGVAITACPPEECVSGQEVNYHTQVFINPNPCQVIGRNTLGKNVKMARNASLLAKGVVHAETCAQPPTIAPPGTPPGFDQCAVAHPVVPSTGSMWHQQTDFSVKGRTEATRLEITRTYQANATVYAGGFGPNWRHNYETVLQKAPIPQSEFFDIIWIDESGGPFFFLRQEDGSYRAPEGSRLTLAEAPEYFEIKRPDRTIYRFGKSVGGKFGLLTKITEKHGESLDFSHDERGRLLTVSSPFAGSITLSYNDKNLITEIHRDRDNLSYFYTYFENGRLASATDFQGRAYTFSYVQKGVSAYSEGMLETITDPIGRVLKFTYDENGRAKQQYEPGGGVWSFSYKNGSTAVRAPNGAVTRYFFDENLREVKRILPDGAINLTEWENGFRKTSCPQFGGKTKFDYDSNGNVTSVQRPEDPSPKQISYNLDFNVPTLVQPIVGAPTQYTLDPETGDVLGLSRGGLSLSFTRDQFGNLLSTNNGRSTYADQRDANGLLTHVFDAHNPEVRSYDQRGRVITRQFLSGQTLSYSYNDDDQEILVTDSHGPTTAKTYDIMRRLIRTDVSSGGVTQTTLFEFDGKDRLKSTTDALGRKTELIYDQIRVREKPIAIKDPAGRLTHLEYDSMDRVVKRTDARGAMTRFTYDQRGNLTSVTDANGQTTSYAFDRNDRKIMERRPSVAGTLPVNRTQLYFFDPADRVVREVTKSATGGTDRAVNYQHDLLDRLVRRIVQREGATNVVEDDSSFTYEDQLDANLTKTAVNEVATLTFTNGAAPPFKSSGFSVAASQSGNPLELIEGNFEISRDVSGEIASISKDGTLLFSKTYDPAGRLTGVSAPGGFSSSISWDGFSRRAVVAHSTGETGNFQFDLLNRITQVSWIGPTPVSQALQYDHAGNIASMQRENGAYSLVYDAVDQLVSSSTTGALDYNRSWTYDLLGNRLQSSIEGTGTFINNFLLSNGVSSFLADAEGFGEVVRETTGGVERNFSFRADGRLNAFQSGATSAAYFFDALGRRTAKRINLGSGPFFQSYVHLDREDRILLGRAGDGTITTYLDGNAVDEHLGEVKPGTSKGYVTDHLGSVLNGEAAGASKSFGLFGEPNSSLAISASSPPVMYGYTGREWDFESSLGYHRMRHYSPRTARWLNQDPVGLAGNDFNYYRYLSNKPLKETDPTGNGPYAYAACLAYAVKQAHDTTVDLEPISKILSDLTLELVALEKRISTCDSAEELKRLTNRKLEILADQRTLTKAYYLAATQEYGYDILVDILCGGLASFLP